jgi:hypothetical protein
VDRRDEPAAKRALRYSVSERSRARPLTASCGCHHEGSGRKQASLSEILLTLLLVPQHLTATTDGQTPEPGFAADSGSDECNRTRCSREPSKWLVKQLVLIWQNGIRLDSTSLLAAPATRLKTTAAEP